MIEEIDVMIKHNGQWKKPPGLQVDFDVNMEDLDSKSYRNPVSGDLISKPVKKNWSSFSFKYENLSWNDVNTIFSYINPTNFDAKIEHPMYTNGKLETKFRVSRKKWGRMKAQGTRYYMEFNMVQTVGVNEQ